MCSICIMLDRLVPSYWHKGGLVPTLLISGTSIHALLCCKSQSIITALSVTDSALTSSKQLP